MTTETIPIRLARRYHVGWTVVLFLSIVVGALLAIPTYAYFYDYSWLDWTLFGVLYLVSGLGITVGYHRLMSHRSFDCPNWVKGALLIAGAWALQNSAIKWTADHLRHHAQCDQEADPYNAKLGFGIATVAGSSLSESMTISSTLPASRRIPSPSGNISITRSSC